MDDSIKTYPCACSSYWIYEWWCSVWPSHPDIQDQRTTWRFSYQHYHISTRNYPIWRNYISYKTSLPVHEVIVKDIQTQSIHFPQYDRSHHINWQQGKIGCLHREKNHGIYCYLETIGSSTTLNTSSQWYHNFGPSSSTDNDTETLQPVIAALCVWQKSVCKLCGRIGHKDDASTIHRPKLPPPSLKININQFNTLHGD